MKTREKILLQALDLFNQKGVDQVSVLEISQTMGISYGNLTYHFKKKDDLVQALYVQMQHELDAAINHLVQRIFEETYYLKLVNELLQVTWKYRFLYLSINSLMNQYPFIREGEKSYSATRNKILNRGKKYLIDEGYLKPESDSHYELLIRNLNMILYAWIVDAELFHEGEVAAKIDDYATLFYGIALTNVTEKGRTLYYQIVQNG
ncbi:TetR/AcrR family transcriptional regulator [Porticoccaceae bacterium]|nr:TetR/AcrR family transcriptional regulator [Porticoccaceae bacterium]MDA8663752.1 TetR/AcrR family transcriptional regulator [Porticoccaceae bacterium]MDA8682797.1 TetR/AcrR family transcriptional regulator [Porticoccaceae bacterium]MDB2343483.1 TetR/AcrR family transcriptional regulator [Porticoccaceae bacterium]